jgi:translocation and assembly module TamA
VRDRKVVVDRERKTMLVTLQLDPGPAATFGSTRIDGLTSVREDYLRRLIPWKPGETFDRRRLEAFRDRLAKTDLFTGVTVKPAETIGPDGQLGVAVQVNEAKHRSIGAEAAFSTDEGFSVGGFWEHRNAFGAQERATLSTKLSMIEQTAKAGLRKPNYGRVDQDILFETSLRHQDSDAFEERSFAANAAIERRYGPAWTAGVGTTAEYQEIEDKTGRNAYLLFGLPLTVSRVTADDLLNPTSGARNTLRLTPYVGGLAEGVSFLTAELTGAHYWSLDENHRTILAGRYKLGSLLGEQTADVPASKRFFAGGGGSVRGYGFQMVGPLDAENDPVGGRSVVEAGLELRYRVTDTIGVVPFVEGGAVYDKSWPEGLRETLWAAGLGLRYYTAIGPIRLDVAVPLDRRRDIDSAYEFYISIGQAF